MAPENCVLLLLAEHGVWFPEHVGWLTTAYNSRSENSNALFWTSTTSALMCIYPHKDVHIHTQFKNSNDNKSLEKLQMGFSFFYLYISSEFSIANISHVYNI